MSPVVARMVSEHSLDIAAIPGTGRGGRVTKRDVELFLEGGAGTPSPAETAAPAAPAPAPGTRERRPAGGPARSGACAAAGCRADLGLVGSSRRARRSRRSAR